MHKLLGKTTLYSIIKRILFSKLKTPHFGTMNENKKSCGSFNQEQNVDYNAKTDCINY
jgi:hypothetical protein